MNNKIFSSQDGENFEEFKESSTKIRNEDPSEPLRTFLNFASIDFFKEDDDDFIEYLIERDLDKANAKMLDYRSRALSKKPLFRLKKIQKRIYKRKL